MQIRAFRAALVAAVTTVAVVVPTVAASAQSQAIKDGASDTWESTYDEQTDTFTWESTGAQADVDVAKTVVRHGRKNVVVTTVYRTLDLSSDFLFVMSHIKTNDGRYLLHAGYDEFSKANASLSKRRGEVKCSGIKASLSKKKSSLTVNFPRTCLKSPRWIKLASTAYAGFSDPENPENFHFYEDAIGKAGHGKGVWTSQLKRG